MRRETIPVRSSDLLAIALSILAILIAVAVALSRDDPASISTSSPRTPLALINGQVTPIAAADYVSSPGGFSGGSAEIGNSIFSGSLVSAATVLDVRVDNGSIPFGVARYSNSSSAGTDMDFVFGKGTIATPASTPQGGNSLLLMRIYGYDTSNAIAESARIGTIVDQPTAAGTVPGEIYFMNTTSTVGGFGGVGLIRRRFTMDSAGHLGSLVSSGLTPGVGSCGSSPSYVGTDTAGTITEGSGATGCVFSFAESWSVTTPTCTPVCTLSSRAGLSFSYTTSAAAITITNIGLLSSTLIDYHCICYGAAVP